MKQITLLFLAMCVSNLAYGASVNCFFWMGTKVADNKFYGYVSQDFLSNRVWMNDYVYKLDMGLIGKLDSGKTILVQDDSRVGKVYLKVFKREAEADEIRAVAVQPIADTTGNTKSGFYMNIFNGECDVEF